MKIIAHNLNVSEMRLLFSLRCADPEILVREEEGAGPTARKQPLQSFFLTFNGFYSFTGGGEHFSGGPTFSGGGGGVQMLISIETHITFPEGGGPDPLSPILIRACLSSHCR